MVARPTLPLAVSANPPRTLSVGDTCCMPSGFEVSSLYPSELRPLKGRPPHDISTGLSGGPSAWEARLTWRMSIGDTSGPLTTAPFRVAPNGSVRLKSWLARPSQKLSRLKTALMTDGALRPVTARVVPVWVHVSDG